MRHVVWFSCGAASAVAAKLSIDRWPETTEVVYCDTMADEHPDNRRFYEDVENWIGRKIRTISSEKYGSVEEVWDDRSYMAGIQGAPCTVEMKKIPRFAYEHADDVHVFGLTADEPDRIERFEERNPELAVEWILRDEGIVKDVCFRILAEAGIEIPAMYLLGYANNNCLGCVKATSAGYWNKIRRDFPDVFERRAETSRRIGARLTRVNGRRVFLDELPPDYLPAEPLESISCGPDCGTQGSLFGETS